MLRRLYSEQPESFEFTAANLEWAKGQIARYPEGRQASAVIPLLWRAQEQEGWVTGKAIERVADLLGMAKIRVLEVASFYFMFQLQPVGSVAHIQVCGTTSCMLCGSEDLISVCREKIAPDPHELSADGKLSWEEVECLGSCSNAPMAQIGKDYYEDLTAERFGEILDMLARGEVPAPGPQNGRFSSEPLGGPTSLSDGMRGYDANASVGLALERRDTVKRIDGSEPAAFVIPPGEVSEPPAPEKAPEPELPVAEESATKNEADEPLAAPEAVASVEETAEPVGQQARGDSARVRDLAKEAGDLARLMGEPVAAPEGPEPEEAVPMVQPAALVAPLEGGPDDLQQIRGIGPKLEELLNGIGYYHFAQIASWSGDEVAWIDANLVKFKGRATRDEWVAQARDLAGGDG